MRHSFFRGMKGGAIIALASILFALYLAFLVIYVNGPRVEDQRQKAEYVFVCDSNPFTEREKAVCIREERR